jgi:hypothetical protein
MSDAQTADGDDRTRHVKTSLSQTPQINRDLVNRVKNADEKCEAERDGSERDIQ